MVPTIRLHHFGRPDCSFIAATAEQYALRCLHTNLPSKNVQWIRRAWNPQPQETQTLTQVGRTKTIFPLISSAARRLFSHHSITRSPHLPGAVSRCFGTIVFLPSLTQKESFKYPPRFAVARMPPPKICSFSSSACTPPPQAGPKRSSHFERWTTFF